MKQRCRNPNNPNYKHYGGRGIDYIDRWESFDAFLADMGERPVGMSLERKNNNKGYSKRNCVWASHAAQMRNRRTNHLLTLNGRTQCLQDWANELGFKAQSLYMRIHNYGWSVERALTTPPMLSGRRRNRPAPMC